MLVPEVERWLDRLYIDAEGAGLRQEDRRKAVEVAAMLDEIGRAVRRISSRVPLVLVDAAAGKSYVGLLAAKLVLEPMGRAARVMTLEREAQRVEASERASGRLGSAVPVECRQAEVSHLGAWPPSPSIVVALHACGPAADAIIDASVTVGARLLLLVPCCTSEAVAFAARAEQLALSVGVPRHAPVRRRFLQAIVDAERTWRLEAAGYETEVVEMVGATVTPHNLLWRARLVGEPVRMAAAARALERLRAGSGQ
ncbi:MAG: methyltransferase [Acidobacteria bacterium]|nr:MAG: methyltransferase [Acidobacteriota bacterium]RPJ75332.1 MAG: methyltransferase [Acidobacteriota bacterium]